MRAVLQRVEQNPALHEKSFEKARKPNSSTARRRGLGYLISRAERIRSQGSRRCLHDCKNGWQGSRGDPRAHQARIYSGVFSWVTTPNRPQTRMNASALAEGAGFEPAVGY
jgi:hypothetical protein